MKLLNFKICYMAICLSFSLLLSGGCDTAEEEEELFPNVLKSTSLFLEVSTTTPRCSEGDIILLKDNRILTIYTRFIDGQGDHDKAVLSGRISDDGGYTWGDERDIVTGGGKKNVMSVSLLRLQNNDIALFYLVKNSIYDCYPVMRTSKDEGITWSDPVACVVPESGYYVLNNSRVIRLKSGRLLMPLSLHTMSNSSLNESGHIFCCYSDDNGKTWVRGEFVTKRQDLVTQEPGVVELKNGKILLYMRTNSGFQYFSYSKDSGKSWSVAQEGNLSSAQSPALIVRDPQSTALIAIWNNSKTVRTPLCLALSKDEGASWTNKVLIESNPNLWFAYPAILFLPNNAVLISYSMGKAEFWGLESFTISRILRKSLNLDK